MSSGGGGGGGISVRTYSGAGDEGRALGGYRAAVQEGPGSSAVHGTTSATSYGPGTGPPSVYYPFVSRSFPPVGESEAVTGGGAPSHQRPLQDTGAGHQSSCSLLDPAAPARRHLLPTGRYPAAAGTCDDNPPPTCGRGIIYNQPCGQQQQQHAAHVMAAAAAAGDPNFVLWTAESGYTSYVVDPRSGATVPRSVQHILSL